MNKQFDINQMRIATPCNVGWENMSGDDKARLCHSCDKIVYNIAEMTPAEVQTLITQREGRICIRLYRRRDGTVLTRDCPVGLRALQRRAIRFAEATLTLILSFCSGIAAQKSIISDRTAWSKNSVSKQDEKGSITGVVSDLSDAVIPSIEVVLVNNNTKKSQRVFSNEDGAFVFESLAPGNYTIKIEAAGFKKYTKKNIELGSEKVERVNVKLEPNNEGEFIGILAEDQLIELNETIKADTNVILRKPQIEE